MQNMRELLRSSLGRSLRDLPLEDRLAAAWSVACGPALASRGEVQHVDMEGVLHVRVAEQQWMGPFLSARAVLQSDLARIAAVPLSGIHFEVTPKQSSPRPRSAGTRTREKHE